MEEGMIKIRAEICGVVAYSDWRFLLQCKSVEVTGFIPKTRILYRGLSSSSQR